MRNKDSEYDLFISYPNEERPFVQQLVPALRDRGLRVWFDEGRLRIGDSVLRSIEDGLEHSRNFLVVVSPKAASSRWSQFELGVALGRKEKTHMFPLYLHTDQEQVAQLFPGLASRQGICAEDHTIEEIADLVAKSVRSGAPHKEAVAQ
jgi:hypothetical protein